MKKYTIHLPHYKADEYGHPTIEFVGDECFVFVRDYALDFIGGITVVSNHAYGMWSNDDMIVRDAQTIVEIVCDVDTFNRHMLPVLCTVKAMANQKSLFVTETPAEIVNV